jgi:hypothetical protein
MADTVSVSTIELVDKNKIRIHERVFHVHHCDPPLPDGTVYNLEASADRTQRHVQHLELRELHGIKGRDLPHGLSIEIDCLRTAIGNSGIVGIDNLYRGLEISESMYFAYSAWHLPGNLVDFVDELKKELEQKQYGMARVTTDRSDATIYVSSAIAIAPDEDCLVSFTRLDDAMRSAHRAALRRFIAAHAKLVVPDAPDSRGVKWWLRYVIVPVLGSGACVALVTWLIRYVA